MITRNKLLVLALCAGVSLPMSAVAQGGTDVSSETIVSAFNKYVTENIQTNPKSMLHLDGDVLVEDSNNYYAITFPDITYDMKDSYKLNAGVILANVSPKLDGDWRVSMAFPKKVTFENPNGKVVAMFLAPQQDITGVWDPEIMFFKSLNASLTDVRFIESESRLDVSARKIERTLKLEKKGERSSSLKTNVNVYGIDGELLNSDAVFSAEQISVDIQHSQIQIQPYMDTLHSMIIEGNVKDLMLELMQFIGEGKSDFVLTNLNVGKNGEDGRAQVARIHGANSVSMVDGGRKNYEFSTDVSGISLQGMDVTLYPERFALGLGLMNVDDSGFEAVADTVGENDKILDSKVLEKVLLESMGSIELKEFVLDFNNGSGVTISGVLRPEGASPMGWAGSAKVVIRDVDRLVEDATKMAQGPHGKVNPQVQMIAQQATMGVAVLKSIGQVETAANGSSTITINLELTVDGRVLVNGQEVNPAMGAALAQ